MGYKHFYFILQKLFINVLFSLSIKKTRRLTKMILNVYLEHNRQHKMQKSPRDDRRPAGEWTNREREGHPGI